MHFSVAKTFASLAHCAVWLLCAGAALAGMPSPPAPNNLPDLPNAHDAAPAHFGLDGERVELGYATRQRTWSAKLDEYLDMGRSLTLDYGTLLTNRLGAGAALQRRSDYSDLWVNGIFAPDRDVRLRVAGGQLRAGDNVSEAGSAPSAVQQNSYLLGARRAWNSGLVSGLGLTAYTVEANDAAVAAQSREFDTDPTADPGQLASGRQQGHVLNLSLRPTTQSRIELWREHGRLTYYASDGSRGDRDLVASRMRFSQSFGDCMRLQGGYSTNQASKRLDLKLGRDRWHVSVARTGGVDGNDLAVGVGYALPLGGSPNGAGNCPRQSESGPAFESIIDSTVRRPEQFPRDPLTAASTLN